jgi:hypothetical protein
MRAGNRAVLTLSHVIAVGTLREPGSERWLVRLSPSPALHKKSVGAVSDRDHGLSHLPKCEMALNRRRRRLPQNDFLCKAVRLGCFTRHEKCRLMTEGRLAINDHFGVETMQLPRLYYIGFAVLAILGPAQRVDGDEVPDAPKWKKHTINDQSPFEAVGVADFDGDDKLDVFSGDSWYAAPNWTRHKVRDVPPWKNSHYYEDFADLPFDVNGDGKVDIVTCAYFSRRVGWVEHPGDPTKPWIEHKIDKSGSMETGYFLDLYGDGTTIFLLNTAGQVGWYELTSSAPQVQWKHRQLAREGAGHGIGHGDVNNDGRIDIITPKGWYEQPADRSADWTFHAEFMLGAAGIEILGHDFDGDGDTDIVWGMGHDFGLYWIKQSTSAEGKRSWTKEIIDSSFSQVHTLQLADFDGDGEQEFVTGKRIYAHASEPGATDKPCLYIYRFDRKSAKWVKTVAYQGEPALNAPSDAEKRDALKDFQRGSAGTGLRMAVKDLDQDGDLDVVTPGQSGLYWFENLRTH